MTRIVVWMLLALTISVRGQNAQEWNGVYQLQLADFQSPSTQIGATNIYSLYTGTVIDFSFYMSNAEFMFTKNFNSKVSCTFNRGSASIVAPDSLIANDLVRFARYEFDLSELYARKFRKLLYEEKGAFSDVNFFKPVFEEIQKEMVERYTVAGRITDLGRNGTELEKLHLEVLKEIEQLADFCKLCKPPKKKK